MNEKEALSILVAHLVNLRTLHGFKADVVNGWGFINDRGYWTSECSPAAELAREWAYELLDAAQADGLCGCPLCQG